MKKKIGFEKMPAFVSFVLMFSLVFAVGAIAVEDSPLAGGMIIDSDGPFTNDVIMDDPVLSHEAAAAAAAASADAEPADGSGDGAPADEVGDLFDEVGAEAEAAAPAPPMPKVNPKTGDSSMLFVVLAAMALAGAGVYSAKRKAK